MIISHKHKFIFFCNGRTGSKSIEYALKKYDDNAKHPFLWKAVQLIRGKFPLPNGMLPSSKDGFRAILARIGRLPYEGKIRFPRTDEYILEHIFPSIARDTLGEDLWNQYFKFVFVRNPWSWVLSCYTWNNRRESRGRMKFDKDSFLRHWEQMKRYKVASQSESYFQYDWIMDANGIRYVNFIGRFENLQEDFNVACKKIGIPCQVLPHLNVTNYQSYRDFYTEEAKALVSEKYKKDITFLGYEY